LLQAALEKKKEKEKAKKQVKSSDSSNGKESPNAGMSIEGLDAEAIKAREAERMAKLLLEVIFYSNLIGLNLFHNLFQKL
jgi:hypothetical protein